MSICKREKSSLIKRAACLILLHKLQNDLHIVRIQGTVDVIWSCAEVHYLYVSVFKVYFIKRLLYPMACAHMIVTLREEIGNDPNKNSVTAHTDG